MMINDNDNNNNNRLKTLKKYIIIIIIIIIISYLRIAEVALSSKMEVSVSSLKETLYA